jgi:hypothetical protein
MLIISAPLIVNEEKREWHWFKIRGWMDRVGIHMGGICEQRRVLVLFGKHMGAFVNKVEF